MCEALEIAGIDPTDIRCAGMEKADPYVFVRCRYEHYPRVVVIVAIQCGQDASGQYFYADHTDEEGDIYSLNPGFNPDDPKWVAETIVKYFRDPKWHTSDAECVRVFELDEVIAPAQDP